MSRVIDFKTKKMRSIEDEAYLHQIWDLELKIEKEILLLRRRVLRDGIETITYEDFRKIGLMGLRLDLLCDIYDVKI